MKYYKAKNTGKGFITHHDTKIGHIKDWGHDIWGTENWRWAAKIGALEMSKKDAQRVIDLAIYGELDEDGNQIEVNLP